TGDLVDDDRAVIGDAAGSSNLRRRPPADAEYHRRGDEQRRLAKQCGDRPGKRQRRKRAPRARRDRQQAGAEPGGEQRRRMQGGKRSLARRHWAPQSGRRRVATAWPAMPSRRPVKPSFSVVVALTLTRRVSR